jgi:hypothetical protein
MTTCNHRSRSTMIDCSHNCCTLFVTNPSQRPLTIPHWLLFLVTTLGGLIVAYPISCTRTWHEFSCFASCEMLSWSMENPRVIYRYVCILHRVNEGAKNIQGPIQVHRGGWQWIRIHDKFYCSCIYGTWRKRRQIGNILQVMHALARNAWVQKYCYGKPYGNICENMVEIRNLRNQSWYVWWTPLIVLSFLVIMFMGRFSVAYDITF